MKSNKRKLYFLIGTLLIIAGGVVWKIYWMGSAIKFSDAFVDKNVTLKDNTEKALAERFMLYQHLRSAHQFEKTYEMELPYYRYLIDYRFYEKESKTTNHDFNSTLTSIRYRPGIKEIAKIDFLYQKNKFKSIEHQRWILVNGAWYHSYSFSPFPE